MATIVVYRGKSQLNGQKIVGLLTLSSKNRKTGDMAQLFILPAEIAPHEAQKTGEDESVCGDCVMRPINKESRDQKYGCYVKTFQGPRAAWQASYGKKADLRNGERQLHGKFLRLGAYGDPAALPMRVLERLTKASVGWTGYTHQWRRFPELKPYCMASVDTSLDGLDAKVKGWRTFRMGEDIKGHEVMCPNKSHGVLCADCRLCDGSVDGDKRKSVVIVNHR